MQARVSYDLAGTGSYSRVETYRYFATDPVPGTETYTQAVGLRSSPGALAAMTAAARAWRCGTPSATRRPPCGSTPPPATAASRRVTVPFTVS